MSKIEEALKKARAKGTGGIPSAGEQESGSVSQNAGGLVPLQSANLVQRDENYDIATVSSAIKNMRELDKISKQRLDDAKIVYPEMEDTKVVNAFREIRTKLLQKVHGQNATIMVTSLFNNHGSSFVVKNLAAAFAFDESKTAVMVDCNLRTPSLADFLQDKDALGLTDYLEDKEIQPEDIIHPTGINRLRLVPAGGEKELASEYFTSRRMRYLLDHIKSRYPDRFVLIDTQPILESADTRILVELCDYIVLVVPYGKATEAQIMSAIREIEPQKLLGIVFNNEPSLPVHVFKKIKHKFRESVSSLFQRNNTTKETDANASVQKGSD